MLNRREKIHFIGIGGAGMLPLAEVLYRMGYEVTGSDSCDGDSLNYLRSLGVKVQVGHTPLFVKSASIVVYTSAVGDSNPELQEARRNGAAVMKRAHMLGDLMRRAFSVAVAGTHGKTSTSSFIAAVLRQGGENPTVIVGGVPQKGSASGSSGVGRSDLLVVEADEYDRSFLQMYPSLAVITNVEEDHLDIYNDFDDIKASFQEFINRVPFYGETLICIDDPGAASLCTKAECPIVTYGFTQDAEYRLSKYRVVDGRAYVTLSKGSLEYGEITLPLIGRHMALNATAAVIVGLHMGMPFHSCIQALETFTGVGRRMEFIGTFGGVAVYDDYAHHPTEVEATISALKEAGHNRLHICFQPHLYSRTTDFFKQFATALSKADTVTLIPIYAAREVFTDRVSSEALAEEIISIGGDARHCAKEDIAKIISGLCERGDAVVLMGAGDITLSIKEVCEVLER